jgi:hypothetical protein
MDALPARLAALGVLDCVGLKRRSLRRFEVDKCSCLDLTEPEGVLAHFVHLKRDFKRGRAQLPLHLYFDSWHWWDGAWYAPCARTFSGALSDAFEAKEGVLYQVQTRAATKHNTLHNDTLAA